MQLKTLAFAAIAAFAFGAGINAAPAEAADLDQACHDRCDVNLTACLAAGTAPNNCYARAEFCHNRCDSQVL